MSQTALLVIGYAVTWLAIAAYLLRLRAREREIRREPPGDA
ncbi:MAG: CcmD family protein [Gemmatimonadota bacterium]|nr:CcmD family protein [Gemmatimonadota bacterium]